VDRIIKILAALLTLCVILITVTFIFLGPVGGSDQVLIFIIPQNTQDSDIAKSLHEQKLIRNAKAFKYLQDNFAKDKEIKSGGYKLNQKMDSWQILSKLTGKPDLFWITFSYCLRKEQIGEKLASTLGWSEEELNKWNTIYTNSKPEYFEGVYYPDTYLIPADESGQQIAQRFITNFNEKFAPLADKFFTKNIKWTTGVKIASLIAREAAGPADMKLISGIIWNRLDKGMPLQIDATMQYTLGKTTDGSWWGNIDISEKQSDSPYNTYKYSGLPPTPICSPNIDAIEATLDSEETDCLYYLHDTSGQIHCAKTYAEHKENISKYLK
jgi:UPF0755 protein